MFAVLLVTTILVLGGVILFLERHQNRSRVLSADDRARIHVRWHEIEQSIKKGGPSNFRQAIIEADKLVDHALKQLGVPGETMGERLRAGANKFTNLDGIWTAHKVRNQLVHEMDRELLASEAKKMLTYFHRALHDLGAL